MHWIDWSIIGLYAFSALAIGLYFTKKASEGLDDFFVAGRSLGWFVLGTSMVATTFSADTPLFVSGISRSAGIFENWLWWSAAMAGMAGVFFFAHLWRRSGIITEIEFISLRYAPSKLNDAFRMFKVVFEGIIMNCILMGGVTIAVGKIISILLPGSNEIYLHLPLIGDLTGTILLVSGIGICAVIYSSLSGLYGVVYTDMIQFILAMVGSIALSVIVYYESSDGGMMVNLQQAKGFEPGLMLFFPSFEEFDLTAFTFVVYMTISWLGVASGSGNMVQRLLAAKTEEDAVKGFFWYNICHYILRPWPWIMIGILSLIYFPDLQDVEMAFPMMINKFLPIGLKGIMIASLFAAYMSTIDTHLNWGSSYVVNDLYKPFIKKEASQEHYVKVARIVMFLITFLAVFVSSQLDSILQVYKYVLLVGGGVGTILIARWYWWRVNLASEITAYLMSFILAPILTIYISNDPDSDYFAIRLVIITTIVTISWILVALFTNARPRDHEISFHKKLKIGGFGWDRVAHITGVQGEGARLKFAFFGWFLGCLMLYGFLLGIGKLLLQQWMEGGIYLLTGFISSLLIGKYIITKILSKMNMITITAQLLLIFNFLACSNVLTEEPILEPVVDTTYQKKEIGSIEIKVSRSFTDKVYYESGFNIIIKDIVLKNTSPEDVDIDSIWIEVGTASTNGAAIATSMAISEHKRLDANEEVTLLVEGLTIDTEGFRENSYLITLRMLLSSPDTTKYLNQETSDYISFFRLSSNQELLTYDIKKEDYQGLPVCKLIGGLSAEYSVQKSVTSINRGISHSWTDINPPRLSSPDFLQRSIDKTVDFYNEEFGVNKKLKTVIISTGITPVSYMSRTMDAPVLPLHFLVGSSTIKEIQTILDYTNDQGTAAYATYGHDYSLSTSKGVAWIKLLDLPESYVSFLNDHQVEEIVFFGATSSGGGEKAARQVKNGIGHYKPGSIYLMYFAGAQAEGYLSQVIKDFQPKSLGPLIGISDWESGIIDEQINAMSISARSNSSVGSISLITSPVGDIHLWNLASYAMLKFYSVNDIVPTGISLNPYLAGHPFYESFMGYVPFAYFNLSTLNNTHIGRVNGMLTNAISYFTPSINIKNLKIIANTGTNSGFYQLLEESNYSNITTLAGEDIWNLADGINSPSEVRARELLSISNPAKLKNWRDNLTYLTIQNFREIASEFTEISVSER